MEEHELRESLRRLPDARPGAAFTTEVLARVERRERQRMVAAGGRADEAARGGARWRPTLLAGGLAAALIAAAGLWQPLTSGRWLGTGGDEVDVPAAPGGERLDEEWTDAGFAAGGQDEASAVPRPEPPAEGAGGARHGGGRRAADAVERPTVADPGASDRLASATAVAGGSEDASGADARQGAAPHAATLPAGDLAALPGADFFVAPPAAVPPPAGFDLSALPAAQRLARLRAERESLERRLVAFRRELPPAEPPVVLLAGDEGLELVFDLGRWAAAPPAGEAAGAVRPAVHSNQGPPRRF